MNASNSPHCLVCQTPLVSGALCNYCQAHQPALSRRIKIVPGVLAVSLILLVLPIWHRVHLDQIGPVTQAEPIVPIAATVTPLPEPALKPIVTVNPPPPAPALTVPSGHPAPTTVALHPIPIAAAPAQSSTVAAPHPVSTATAPHSIDAVPEQLKPLVPEQQLTAARPISAGQDKTTVANKETAAAMKLVSNVESSIEQFKKQAAVKPITDHDANVMKAKLRTECVSALGHGDKALALNPQNPVTWRVRVRALYLLDRKPAAAIELNKALVLFPKDSDLKQLKRSVAP